MQQQNYKTTQLPPIESLIGRDWLESETEHQPKEQLTQSVKGNIQAQKAFLEALKFEKENDVLKAIKAYEKLAILLPKRSRLLSDVYMLIGMSYFEIRNYPMAISYYNKAIKLVPENYVAYRHLGIVYVRQGKLVRAIQSFRNAVKQYPQDEKSHFFLGNLYSQQNHWELAIQSYEKSIEVNKYFEMSYVYLAGLYLNLGESNVLNNSNFFLKAINVYKNALNISSKQAEIYNDIGVVYSLLGNDKEALKAFRKAIEIDPADTVAQSNMFELRNSIVKERLVKKGSLEKIPEPITDFTSYKNRKLFQVKGKPLSQTIIEERR